MIKTIHPTALIGVSGCAGVFTEKAIRTMAQFTKRPIIFPLSNPTSHCEATPVDLMQWTNGQALIATGTQFPDVSYKGQKIKIDQCNNYYIFPAMGLAVLAAKAKRVTPGMFLAAAEGLSALSPALLGQGASLFPAPEQVRDIAKKLAFVIGRQAMKERCAPEASEDALQQAIEQTFWEPKYAQINVESD